MKTKLVSRLFMFVLALAGCVALEAQSSTPSPAGVIDVSIPVGSQANDSHPAIDNVWSATAPINVNLGIGYIINPTYIPGEILTLHQDSTTYANQPHYIAPNVPNPALSTVSYTFDRAVVISGVRIIQHLFGVTRISGALGGNAGSLATIGNVFGPSGDVPNNTFVVSQDGATQDFIFGGSSFTGTRLSITVTKTAHESAYGVYGIIPLDGNGQPIYVATTVTPKVIGVSIPAGSQANDCRPALDNFWAATTPINADLGIGIILNPNLSQPATAADFALHQDLSSYSALPHYVAPNVPNPALSTVSYTFNQPVAISGVRIYQHLFGITQVRGMLGGASGPLNSLGDVFGPSGDVPNNAFVVGQDGATQDFIFGNTQFSGTRFDLTVTKTANEAAYAIYRIIPLDGNGQPVYADTTTTSDPCVQLQAQLDAANATIQSLTTQLSVANNQIATLTSQNIQLQSLLSSANATIQTLTTQNAQLQTQLTAVSQQNQALTQFFRTTFNDPSFQIPGATLQQQIQSLVQAIEALSSGQQKAFYKNLGGKK